ncbi:MAG: prephenate dehydratase [Planctomycetota bacterium]|nr:MAG: prephenate dehydratase [Planctomycetota bacterium]
MAKKATRPGRSKTRPKPRRREASSASESQHQSELLADVRKKIDRIDMRLVKLLNERARMVVEIGKLKRAGNTPIYAPHREAEVLERVLRANTGPLQDRSIEGVFRELMSGSFALEHPLRIGYLGPPGSYSHLAATKHFGSSVSFEDLHEIAGVVVEVRRGHVNYGLVPIENSTGGGISETLTALQEHAGHVQVYAEVQIAIHHALLANCEPSQIRRIHSKPEALGQCRTWLATQFPNAELIPAPSSSRAAQTAVEEDRLAESIGAPPGSAAIGSVLAGQLYGLQALFEEIEDNPNNITRFYVLSKQRAKRTGDDKTAIMFNTADKPGALVSVLSVFEEAGINLTHIDKRPSGRDNWQYTFFIDAQGHRDDPAMKKALSEAERHCRELIVLGSFPRSKRIL